MGAFVPDECCCDDDDHHRHESFFVVPKEIASCLQCLRYHKENCSNCSFVVDDDADLRMFDSHPCSLEENQTCYSCDVVAVPSDQYFPFDYDAGDAKMLASCFLVRQ